MTNAPEKEKKIPDHFHQRDKTVDDQDRKSLYIKVRVSPTEKAKIDAAVTAANMTIAEYVREAITDKADTPSPTVTIGAVQKNHVPAILLDICQYVANANGIVLEILERGLKDGWDTGARHTIALEEINVRLIDVSGQLDDLIDATLKLITTKEGKV